MALLSHFMRSVLSDQEAPGHFVNYGFDRLRLVEPVPVGARVRGRFVVDKVVPEASGTRIVFDTQVEIEGSDRPALVAKWVVAHIDASG